MVWWRSRRLLLLTIALMLFAFAGVTLTSPALLVAAFNPVSLNLSMIALAVIAYVSGVDLPSSASCLRQQPENLE